MANRRPIELQALPKLLTLLAGSFYELKTAQNTFDRSYHGKREAAWLVLFYIQIQIIIIKKWFHCGRVESKALENLEPLNK